MDKEDTKKAIEVMQAYVDGAKIEYRPCSGVWQDSTTSPVWAWNAVSYRIKPAQPLTGMFDEERQFIPGQSFRLNIPCIELTNEVKEALEKAGISYE